MRQKDMGSEKQFLFDVLIARPKHVGQKLNLLLLTWIELVSVPNSVERIDLDCISIG